LSIADPPSVPMILAKTRADPSSIGARALSTATSTCAARRRIRRAARSLGSRQVALELLHLLLQLGDRARLLLRFLRQVDQLRDSMAFTFAGGGGGAAFIWPGSGCVVCTSPV
jgi:hypothetical protein